MYNVLEMDLKPSLQRGLVARYSAHKRHIIIVGSDCDTSFIFKTDDVISYFDDVALVDTYRKGEHYHGLQHLSNGDNECWGHVVGNPRDEYALSNFLDF